MKGEDMYQKKSAKIPGGLLIKITGTASVFVLLAIVVLALLSIFAIEKIGFNTAVLMGKDKLKGDMASFEYMLSREYGSLSLQDGQLVDQDGKSLYLRYEIVDKISADLGIVATIFLRDSNDYRRIATSITDASGKRVVDTLLASDGAAYSAIQSGKDYIGNAVILGKDYLTAYRPVFKANSRNVIGIFFIGIEMSSIKDSIQSESSQQIVKIVSVASVILVLAILLNAISCIFMILRPIRSAVEMLKEISQGEGDLTRRLKVTSKDEIGDMAYYFNMTLEKIRQLVLTIKEQTVNLFNIGSELSSNMNETASAVTQITANIESIKGRIINQSASISETNATMEQITSNINNLNSHVAQQVSSVSQSSSAIEEMLANIQSVTETLIKNGENVHTLSEASEVGRGGLQEVAADIQEIARESSGLLEINSVMENIASQTNLLSMNAAIEAAHAGESGKGFAVVADEIRKLAESSGEQSKTISMVLKKIKTSIDKITHSTENVLDKFQSIDHSVKTVSQQESNIRNAMEEQGEGSKQILDAIGRLNELTTQVNGATREMFAGAKEVIQESKNLEEKTQEITGGMNEMASGAEQINTAINFVNEISGKNRENIDILVQEVSRFKVE
jgi:methyl-accepting chemotaxis protein